MGNSIRRVLAVETSCDDTSVALITDQGFVEACCSANQDLAHQPFGGIVPEIASRNHSETILPLIETTLKKSGKGWSEVDGLAVTSRPGLMGSLMVGVVTVKTLALAKKLPWIAVNHIEGHLLAPLLKDAEYSAPPGFDFPYLALAISGGHSHLFKVEGVGRYKLIGRTVDDAAGEAFDKFAARLGLGFPGGVQVDKLAQTGDPKRFAFPRGMIHEANYDFSFSGLKTAGARALEGLSHDERRAAVHDLCASFQEAIVDVLLAKMERAAEASDLGRVVLTGGVSANSRLRERASDMARRRGWQLAVPPLRYCTDNAAMIGLAGVIRLNRGERSELSLGPRADSAPDDFQ